MDSPSLMEQGEPPSSPTHYPAPPHHKHTQHHSHHAPRHHHNHHLGGGQHPCSHQHGGDMSPPYQGCGGDGGGGEGGEGRGEGGQGGMRPPVVMGMLPDRYREAFSAHERAVFVEENRQRDRRRTAVEKGVLIRGPWYLRIEYWAGIVGICAFVHQLFITYVVPRLDKGV